jgi:microcin C transport system substrate-binding protein
MSNGINMSFKNFHIILGLIILWVSPLLAEKQHGIAMHNDLKYPAGFKNFDYVNPNAPKGGTLKLGVVGTFDSTNPYITKGSPPVGLSLLSERLVFESLMERSKDEPFSLYSGIAESVEVAPDRSWITFYINPKAKWADGKPITVNDVIFSHKTLRDKGRANSRLFYSRVAKVEKVGTNGVKFTFKPKEDGSGIDPELPLLIALMSVLPEHFFAGRDFEKVSLEPMMGSGPYRIVEIKPAHRIVYERRPDYWAKDLPASRGKDNFDRVEVNYYREANVARVAFAAGEFDVKAELNPAEWYKAYDFKAVKSGQVKKVELDHINPMGMFGYCFNTRRDIFKDPRVRRALAYAFDFKWINDNFFHGVYKRHRSYFDNSELAATGLPSKEELALLDPYKSELPQEVFTQQYTVPEANNQTELRANLKKAKELLEQAGWHVKDGVLSNDKSCQKFEFELLLYNKEDEKVAIAFARQLKHLGIIMKIRTVDPAQFERRRMTYDYDMIAHTWGVSRSPGNEQYYYWGSKFVEEPGSRNYAGIKLKAVDALCGKVATAKTRPELLTALHALDRVLLWGHYVVPLYYNNKSFLAYWDKFGFPAFTPGVPVSFMSWWSKAAEQK